MLYRTHHHPFLYTLNPFPHSSLSPHLLSSSSSSSNPLQRMECVHGALADGLGPEAASKTAPFLDDFPVNGVYGDDLFVDELLDFSNGFDEEEGEQQPQKLEEPEWKEQDEEKTCSASLEKQTPPENDDFGPLPESELSAEGLESLEWLSHFVEDSFPDYSLTGKLSYTAAASRPAPESAVKEQACFTTPVQTKARTKRARTGVRVWPVLSPSFAESSTSSSSSTSATSFSPPTTTLTVQSQTGELFNVKQPPTKKQKKKPAEADAGGGAGAGQGQARRCSHCGVTKTPQWRAGPLGSKTLCNACGVRYKSGRLLPEYRPACSPTFSSELHSNNHRKVLEMRRKKEPESEAAAGRAPPVHSF